ncbi:MAG: hypothetical protein OEW99_03620 [Gammaproteobacteria bacterium]|nr:hypothetical protein [Gammaproteobacteria bacterium]
MHTSMANPAEYHFGGGLIKFEYTEYDDNNVFLDGETGFIPGIVLKRKQNYQRLYTEIAGQLNGNTIEYDGQTQSGTPLKTDSDAIIFDTHFKLGIHFSAARNHGPYLGIGYRYWLRNIRSGYDINGNPVAGLLEHYHWNYGLLGYAATFNVSENVNLGFDLRHTQMINGKMDINFLGYCGYDNAQVDLGNESGTRFAMPIQIKLTRHSLIVAPYYEIIDIGKSNTVALTRNGSSADCNSDGFFDGAFEPRSETRNAGINVTLLW